MFPHLVWKNIMKILIRYLTDVEILSLQGVSQTTAGRVTLSKREGGCQPWLILSEFILIPLLLHLIFKTVTLVWVLEFCLRLKLQTMVYNFSGAAFFLKIKTSHCYISLDDVLQVTDNCLVIPYKVFLKALRYYFSEQGIWSHLEQLWTFSHSITLSGASIFPCQDSFSSSHTFYVEKKWSLPWKSETKKMEKLFPSYPPLAVVPRWTFCPLLDVSHQTLLKWQP